MEVNQLLLTLPLEHFQFLYLLNLILHMIELFQNLIEEILALLNFDFY